MSEAHILDYASCGFASASDHTRIFYGESGQGPTWVLLDGLGCDGFAWTYLYPRLTQKFRVVHMHYRGHGRSASPQSSNQTHVSDLAQDVLSVLDHLAIKDAVLCGHSLGTQVALEVYRAAPERVRGMVLICGSSGKLTAVFRGNGFLKKITPKALDFVRQKPGLVRALWSRFPGDLAYRVATAFKEVDPFAMRKRDFLSYVGHFRVIDPELWLQMLDNAGTHDASDMLSTIHVPTLVIAAERDTFTPTWVSQQMADAIPGSTYALLRAGSHAAPVEQPVIIAEHIQDWINTKLPTSEDAKAISKPPMAIDARPHISPSN